MLRFWSARTATLLTAVASVLFADEGTKATAENDKKPRVCLPVKKEEEGVPAEPGSPAQGGPAGERAAAEGEPGPEAETGWERGETVSVSQRTLTRTTAVVRGQLRKVEVLYTIL